MVLAGLPSEVGHRGEGPADEADPGEPVLADDPQGRVRLGLVREVEVRTALAKFGIFNVWILDGKDTPGQDVFHSLHNSGHGELLENIIRLVRLTRPEIIITWMPIFVAGENHGDHQAAGILATEAFDMAGDPTLFPTQVTVPRDRWDINNFQEGLHPWQPKKLYYFSDREESLTGIGPHFDISSLSKTKNIPFYQIAAELHTTHLVQGDVAEVGLKALETGDFSDFIAWLSRYQLIFGKSVVECRANEDVFEGITSDIAVYKQPTGYIPEEKTGITVEAGGVFAFYHKFWRAHDIEHLANLIHPEIMIAGGSFLHFPLLISNYTSEMVDIQVKIDYPEGWQPYGESETCRILPGQSYPVQSMLQAPFDFEEEPVILTWTVENKGKIVESVQLIVHLREWTLPQ